MRKRFSWKEWKLPSGAVLSQFDDDISDDEDTLFDIQQDIQNETGIDFFVLNTNFIIKFPVIEYIIQEQIPGVEVIKPLTNYKMLVGVPSSGFFNAKKVQKAIEESFLGYDKAINLQFDTIILTKFDSKTAHQIIDIRNSLYDSQDYWILYVFPNSKTEIITDTDKTDYFLQCLDDLTTLYFSIGGTIISSTFYDAIQNEESEDTSADNMAT